MFGTLEGVITSLNDSHLITVKKPILTAVLCASACMVGMLFSTRAGQVHFSEYTGSKEEEYKKFSQRFTDNPIEVLIGWISVLGLVVRSLCWIICTDVRGFL